MESRELVYSALEFKNPPRVPRDIWSLPWIRIHFGNKVDEIYGEFPPDMEGAPFCLKETPPIIGDPCEPGDSTDAWGCRFYNNQRGVHGEVKEPIVTKADWSDASGVRFPREWLTVEADVVNRHCAKSHKFISGGCCPRPFEQLQFMRGSENLFYDLADEPPKMMGFISLLHEFYCELMHIWAKTDVDCLNMMDDWGTQKSLLISPGKWRAIFGPMYRDYINIAHSAGKKMFMHSDGYTLSIIPDLIDMGLDAFNTQIFCMGPEVLEQFAGRITFWGEIDRQYLLCYAPEEEVAEAVRDVYGRLWRNGGCIAQLELGAGTRLENARRAYETWEAVMRK